MPHLQTSGNSVRGLGFPFARSVRLGQPGFVKHINTNRNGSGDRELTTVYAFAALA